MHNENESVYKNPTLFLCVSEIINFSIFLNQPLLWFKF